jgi:rod shape-determining protein MreD
LTSESWNETEERMRDIKKAVLGILLAVFLYSVLGKISAPLVVVLNAFAWVVLYLSLVRHEAFGATIGTVCGLLQDSFSSGVFGVAGLTKTLLGFSTGYVARKINVTPVGRNFVFLLLMATAEVGLWKILTLFLFRESLSLGGGLVLLQPLVTALVVTVFYQVMRKKKEEIP